MRLTKDNCQPHTVARYPSKAEHYWQGRSGNRYAHDVKSIETVQAGESTVVIFAILQTDGEHRAAWIGSAEDPAFRAARAACRQIGRCQAHVHTPGDSSQTDQIVSDLLGLHPVI